MAVEKKAVHKKSGGEKSGNAKAQAGHVKAHSGKAEGQAVHGKKEVPVKADAHAGHAKPEGPAVHKHEAVHEKAEAEKGKGKAVEKKVPVKISKSREVKRLSRLVLAKKRPMFRGRFGQRAVRNVGDAKWKRWRKPRGIDIYFRREDGLVPGTGYQRPKEIRFVHPSGYRERLVCNLAQLLALEKERAVVAARISGKVGKRKKELFLKKADELKIVVLNR